MIQIEKDKKPYLTSFLRSVVVETLINTTVDVVIVLLDQHEQRLATLGNHARIFILERLGNTTENLAALGNSLLNLLSTTTRGIISLVLDMKEWQEEDQLHTSPTLKARPEMEQRQRMTRSEKTPTACLRTIGYMLLSDLRTIFSVYR